MTSLGGKKHDSTSTIFHFRALHIFSIAGGDAVSAASNTNRQRICVGAKKNQIKRREKRQSVNVIINLMWLRPYIIQSKPRWALRTIINIIFLHDRTSANAFIQLYYLYLYYNFICVMAVGVYCVCNVYVDRKSCSGGDGCNTI